MARSPAHVKVHLAVRTHDKTIDIYTDPRLRGIWLGLLIEAQAAFAAKRGNRVNLSHGTLMSVTGESTVEGAVAALREVTTTTGWRVDEYRNRVAVTVRNLAKRQGIDPLETVTQERREKREEGREKSEEVVHTPAPDGAAAFGEPGSEKPKPSIPKGQRSVAQSKKLALEVWPELVQRAASYGKSWSAEPQRKQLELLTQRIRQGATRAQCHAAIDGFMALHRDQLDRPERPMRSYFRATTIYQASKFEEYLEQAVDADQPNVVDRKREDDLQDLLKRMNEDEE
ncbi:MAG: hypothetical protein WBG86_15990 [Polyangiales bacterium]